MATKKPEVLRTFTGAVLSDGCDEMDIEIVEYVMRYTVSTTEGTGSDTGPKMWETRDGRGVKYIGGKYGNLYEVTSNPPITIADTSVPIPPSSE